ncbi:MAG: T9SS type A sorting domain-containing protein [Caldithrix sp.]|nr:MAG: T9SS type A sorting domain-containing protein [Caldithrix sp.]
MKKIMLVIVSLQLSGSIIYGQNFTRTTAGDIVNDTGRSTGCSWIDFDGDEDLDLFVSNGNQNSEANFLYENNGDGTFTKITTGLIVTDSNTSIGGTWGDYDNDGDPDLFVTNREGQNNSLYRNEGNGAFTKITSGKIVNDGGNSNSSSWVDIDNDNNLDLFVVNFNEANFLYMNNGDGSFTKIETGVIVTEVTFSICGIWGDYDNDNDPDLFIANAGSRNNSLYRNDNGGQFVKITTGAIVNDGGSAIGCSWGDYNNDSYLDLFVANFLNQNNFLYRNNGDGTFTKITSGAIVSDGGNSVGSTWSDFDNDGDVDLFVGNDGQNNFLYSNNGNGQFTKITSGDIVNTGGSSFGLSSGDFDDDGNLDVFVANRAGETNFLFVSDGNGNSWLNVKCIGVVSNTSAIGVKVSIMATINDTLVWQTREISAQTGYNSETLRAHFGLGNATLIDSLRVIWPSGTIDVFEGFLPNKLVTITEGGEITGIEKTDRVVLGSFILSQNYPNPFNPQTTIEYILTSPSHVVLKIYNLRGQVIKSLVNEPQGTGIQTATWTGENGQGQKVSSGVYIYQIKIGDFITRKKMLLIK